MSTSEQSLPVRTCVGCRERAVQDVLVRLVLVDNTLVADPQRTAHGRGVYLHPSAHCGELAVARKAFSKAFRAPLHIRELPEPWFSLMSTNSPSRDTGA